MEESFFSVTCAASLLLVGEATFTCSFLSSGRSDVVSLGTIVTGFLAFSSSCSLRSESGVVWLIGSDFSSFVDCTVEFVSTVDVGGAVEETAVSDRREVWDFCGGVKTDETGSTLMGVVIYSPSYSSSESRSLSIRCQRVGVNFCSLLLLSYCCMELPLSSGR